MDINASRGMRNGASEEKIRAIDQAATSPLFDDVERAAIAYAETVTITGAPAKDGAKHLGWMKMIKYADGHVFVYRDGSE